MNTNNPDIGNIHHSMSGAWIETGVEYSRDAACVFVIHQVAAVFTALTIY